MANVEFLSRNVAALLSNGNAKMQKTVDALQAQLESIPTQEKRSDILDAVKNKLSTLSDSERRIVSRNLAELAKRNTSKEVQSDIEQLHQAVEAMQVTTTPVSPVAPTSSVPQTWGEWTSEKWEGTKEWTKENLDVTKWSTEKKATVATLTIGAIGLYALWRWMRGGKEKASGSEPKKSWFRKVLPWIPVVGLAAWGAKWVYDNVKSVKDRVNAALAGVQGVGDVLKKHGGDITIITGGVAGGAAEKFLKRSDEAAKVLSPLPKGLYELLSNGNVSGALDEGWIFAKRGGKWVATNAKEMYTVPAKYFDSLSDEKISTFDCAWLYGEAGVSYLLGRGTLKALMTGKLRLPFTSMSSLGMASFRVAAWPGAVLRDAGNTLLLVVQQDGRVILKTTASRWGPLGWVSDFHWSRLAKSGDVSKFQRAVLEFQRRYVVFRILEDNVEGVATGNVSPRSVEAYRRSLNSLATEIREGLEGVVKSARKAGDVPGWLSDLSKNADKLGDVEKVRTHIDTAAQSIRNMTEAGAAQGTARTTGSTTRAAEKAKTAAQTTGSTPKKSPKVTGAADAASSGRPRPTGTHGPHPAHVADAVPSIRIAPGTERVAESADEILRALGGDGFLAQLEKAYPGIDPEKVFDVLRRADKADPEVLAKIGTSVWACRTLARAADAGDVAKVNKALRIAKAVNGLKIATTTVGVAGDVFGIAMASVDSYMNAQRIAETDNEQLKALYGDAYKAYGVEAGVSALGLGTVGAEIWGGSYFAGVGMLALPAAVAGVGGRYYHQSLEYAQEQWLKKADDWKKLTEAQLLEKLVELSPGKSTFGQKVVLGTQAEWLQEKFHIGARGVTSLSLEESKKLAREYAQEEEQKFHTIEVSNMNARFEICKAYFIRVAFRHYPSKKSESQEIKDKRDLFVLDQIGYLTDITKGWYNVVNPDVFRNVEVHADLMAQSRSLQEKGESQELSWEDSGEIVTFDIAQYIDKHTAEKRGEVIFASIYQQKLRSIVDMQVKVKLSDMRDERQRQHVEADLRLNLLSQVQHDINRLNGKIETYNYPGLFDGYEKDLTRFVAHRELQTTLQKESEVLVEKIRKGESLSVQDMDASLMNLGVLSQKDPLEFFKQGMRENHNISEFRDRADRLTVGHIAKSIRLDVKGPSDTLHVSELIDQKEGDVFANTSSIRIEGAKGYRFVPIKKEQALGAKRDKSHMIVGGRKGTVILPVGRYAIFAPGEKIDYDSFGQAEIGQSVINFREKRTPIEEKKRLQLEKKRYQKGVDELSRSGATVEKLDEDTFSVSFSSVNMDLIFFFDREVGEWKVKVTEGWADTDNGKIRTGLHGQNPETYRVKGMRTWTFGSMTKQYNAIIAQLGKVNRLELPSG